MYVEALLLTCSGLSTVVSARGGVVSVDLEDLQRHGAEAELMGMSLDWPKTPRYVESLQLLTRNGEALKELLPHESLRVTDPRRHYILIAGVLACVVEYLNSDCTPPDYEHEYFPAVDIILPIVWQDPRAAVSKLEGFIDDVNDTVHHIQELVNLHCADLQPSICDRVIQAIASDTDELDEALDLLITVGELASIYEANRYDKEAANFNAVGLLLNGQQILKPLVYKAAEVYNTLYGKHCEA